MPLHLLCLFLALGTVQAEEYLETLEPLSQKLEGQFPAAKFDRKSLGQLVGQIRQLQEDALGIKVCILF